MNTSRIAALTELARLLRVLKGMPLMRLLFGLCLSMVALPASAQQYRSLAWSTIENRRGASVDFPEGLFTKEASTDKNKMAFSTEDGRGRFELFSIANTRRESPAQFARRADSGRDRLDYKRISGNFIAVSTIQNSRIPYRRCNFNGGMIHCVDLRYPAAEKRAWDDTVTRVSLSLRPL